MTARTDDGALRRLAVYGTLAPGRVNHHKLSDLPGHWLDGQVRGTLTQDGWGADVGYPGLVLDPTADEVNVFILDSPALPEHWERLDAFEGPGYRRMTTLAQTPQGAISTSIYVLAPGPSPEEERTNPTPARGPHETRALRSATNPGR